MLWGSRRLQTGRSKPPRLGCSASGPGPAEGAPSAVGLRLPRWVRSGVQLLTVPPGGALLLEMAEEQAPLSRHVSRGCFIMSTNCHRPEQVHGPAQSQWGRERDTLPPGRRVDTGRANQIIALVFWVFLKRPHAILVFSQG